MNLLGPLLKTGKKWKTKRLKGRLWATENQVFGLKLALVMAVDGNAASYPPPPEPSNPWETRSVIGKDSLDAEL